MLLASKSSIADRGRSVNYIIHHTVSSLIYWLCCRSDATQAQRDHPHNAQLVTPVFRSQGLEDRFQPLRTVGGEHSQHACLGFRDQRRESLDALRRETLA